MKSKREYKFNLQDVLQLLNPSGEQSDRIIIADAQHCEEETWSVLPMNSKLLLAPENLNRKVESIWIWDGMHQIWLANEERM